MTKLQDELTKLKGLINGLVDDEGNVILDVYSKQEIDKNLKDLEA
jgi:hypothetical protein